MAKIITLQDVLNQARPDPQHDWLMPTKLVAQGYEVGDSTIRNHKKDHADELLEGQHWLKDDTGSTHWTKRGVIRLGMFVQSERASQFRNMAETLVLKGIEQGASEIVTQPVSALPTAEVGKLDSTAAAIADVVVGQLNAEEFLTQRVNHHVQQRLDAQVAEVSADALGKSLAAQWGIANLSNLTQQISATMGAVNP